MITAAEVIRMLNLKPHPEGGYYAETYRSAEQLEAGHLPARYSGSRSVSTAIYYLLVPGTCSSMHRIKSDELFHFYLGDPVEMLLLHPDGSGETVILGSDIVSGMLPQVTVPRGVWQGSVLRNGGEFALMGTTVAPGFDFSDFETGSRDTLIGTYPDFAAMITRLAV